jgi:uracil phosphoribosyltransferase
MSDSSYTDLPRGRELAHHYGPRVHLLSEPFPMSVLARLCRPDVVQPEVDHLVARLFDWLLVEVASRELRTEAVATSTRMKALHPEGTYRGEAIARGQRVVVVDVARAGILPSHRFYQGLHACVDAENIRQDHVVASRTTDESGAVVGVSLDGSKIGGPVTDATVIIPDPMAATGTSLGGVIRHYQQADDGAPRKIVAVHLIVTPEYLARMARDFPEVEIYAIRLDRGLSDGAVLQTTPGERWAEEKGLNDRQYIVPGAGGVGEVLNNAWV